MYCTIDHATGVQAAIGPDLAPLFVSLRLERIEVEVAWPRSCSQVVTRCPDTPLQAATRLNASLEAGLLKRLTGVLARRLGRAVR